MADAYPIVVDFVALTGVFGAPRGMVGCSHVVVVGDREVARFDHPPAPVAFEGAGTAFRTRFAGIRIDAAGPVQLKTRLQGDGEESVVTLPALLKADHLPRLGS
ncbi:hypothetical protein D3C87_1859410 [compost metagenome]